MKKLHSIALSDLWSYLFVKILYVCHPSHRATLVALTLLSLSIQLAKELDLGWSVLGHIHIWLADV